MSVSKLTEANRTSSTGGGARATRGARSEVRLPREGGPTTSYVSNGVNVNTTSAVTVSSILSLNLASGSSALLR